MAQFHFVEDYEHHVAELIKTYPMDEAMSLAIGGNYEHLGNVCSEIVIHAGLKDGMSALDFGCGSGRVAHALSKRVEIKQFLGTDIVQSLLNYAKTKTPKHYVFKNHRELNIPANDKSFDVAYAFSVLTHLLPAECFIYMQDIGRVLNDRGRFVFSFLEFAMATHWTVFETSVNALKLNQQLHLNTFLERDQIRVMAEHAGFRVIEFIDGLEPRWSGHMLGQSIAILVKI